MKCKGIVGIIGLGLVFLLIFFGSFYLGRYPVNPPDVCRIMITKIWPGLCEMTWTPQMEAVVWQVRFPRVLAATAIGAGLAVAGAAYQAIFRNPMVSPEILGVSQGAGFGAALGILMSAGYMMTSLMAFGVGLLAVAISLGVAMISRADKILGLVLAGIMVSSIFGSALSLVKLMADPNNELQVITYWLMGSLASIRMADITRALPWIVIGMGLIIAYRWHLGVMMMGEEASSLGIPVKRIRLQCIFGATLISAAAVSISGMIGWIGLVIPHFCRLLLGNDYRYVIPGCVLLGASFLLAVDNIARLLASSEIPIGILTSFVGAPVLLILMLRRKGAYADS
ncbi:MAG: iron ABC transporter permease [Eubacteriales bacterium]|nr:iron ABC transporter permease [Eubacteriales bacterium]